MLYYVKMLELELNISKNDFKKQLERTKNIVPTNFGHYDKKLMDDGICVTYYDDSKKRKIRLMVLPDMLPDKLETMIDKYFESNYSLNDFKVSRIEFAADIDVGSREKVSDYLKILRSIGRVKCFTQAKDGRGRIAKDGVLALNGNSNGVEFRVFRSEYEKGVLCAEVRLTKKAVINAYADGSTTAKQIQSLTENCEYIFMDTFRHIIPAGNYFKKPKAEKLIYNRVPGGRVRRDMIRLVELIPEKKSLLLAQKALKVRDIKEVLDAFAEIELSPVTISKRMRRQNLDSLYKFM